MRQGASIVEVVVAFAVLGVSLPALFTATGLAAALARRAGLLEGAGALAEMVADSILGEPEVRPGTVIRGPYEVDVAVTDADGVARIEITVRYADGGTERELVLSTLHNPFLPRVDDR